MAPAQNGADPDEWEYEYSTTETQDFFVTLDLTSRIMSMQSKKGYVRLEHDIFAADDADKDGEHEQDDAADPAEGNATPHKPPSPEPGEYDRIQIVGLEDDNPIVSYQGHIYSCQWASTIGTDLLFTRAVAPEDGEDQAAEPLRKLGTFDLLGASSARLVATTARLRPRIGPRGPTQPQPAPAAHPFAPIENTDSTEVVKFPLPEYATRAQRRQATFLEQLSAIKTRLGEKDKVKPSAYTSRGANIKPGEDDGTQGQRIFVTSPSPPRVGDFTFITEDGSDPPSPKSPRQSPKRKPSPAQDRSPNKRARRGGARLGSPSRARAAHALQETSPLRNELSGAAGLSAERATPATWDELDLGPYLNLTSNRHLSRIRHPNITMPEPSAFRAFLIVIAALMCLRNIDDHPHSDDESISSYDSCSDDDTTRSLADYPRHGSSRVHHHHRQHHHEDHIPYAPRLISRHIA
ncbi:transcription factor tfiiic tau55-related protein [Diplodia corticola]|uniref:Transcription factor tfiiic tau55-related protein n=1 Tax=Diplodia corticola TaxID=236234 RepID=A0A1J9RXU8_9PEZI|nr:transcription factor tfiiic tau55-related protein [Diplodia corticola]OJD32644.1 transcription factor tfiiic tau55-related protein [Diplodia corticola]